MGGSSAVTGSYLLYKFSCGSGCATSRINGSTSIDSIRFKVINSKEDAVAFLASEGAVRGVAFESAIAAIRELNPDMTLSDTELAEEILKFE